MKLYKKSECMFKHGYVIGKDGEVVCLHPNVARQLSTLDEVYQKYQYLMEQQPYHEAPSLDGFERKTWRKHERKWQGCQAPSTPLLDQKAKEAMQFIEEMSAVECADRINYALERYSDLLDFCADDEFIAPMLGCTGIECVSLGNPLELTVERVKGIIIAIASKDFPDD